MPLNLKQIRTDIAGKTIVKENVGELKVDQIFCDQLQDGVAKAKNDI